jgi:hypothetical protein
MGSCAGSVGLDRAMLSFEVLWYGLEVGYNRLDGVV